MSIIKTTLIVCATSCAIVGGASAQGQEPRGPQGNYKPEAAPTNVQPPVGQNTKNGDYKPESMPAPGTVQPPVGQNTQNGDYKPMGK